MLIIRFVMIVFGMSTLCWGAGGYTGGSCETLGDWAANKKINCDLHEHQVTFGTCRQDYSDAYKKGVQYHGEAKAFLAEQSSKMTAAGKQVVAKTVGRDFDSTLIAIQTNLAIQASGKFDKAKCLDCVDECVKNTGNATTWGTLLVRLVEVCPRWAGGAWGRKDRVKKMVEDKNAIHQKYTECATQIKPGLKSIHDGVQRFRDHLKLTTQEKK